MNNLPYTPLPPIMLHDNSSGADPVRKRLFSATTTLPTNSAVLSSVSLLMDEINPAKRPCYQHQVSCGGNNGYLPNPAQHSATFRSHHQHHYPENHVVSVPMQDYSHTASCHAHTAVYHSTNNFNAGNYGYAHHQVLPPTGAALYGAPASQHQVVSVPSVTSVSSVPVTKPTASSQYAVSVIPAQLQLKLDCLDDKTPLNADATEADNQDSEATTECNSTEEVPTPTSKTQPTLKMTNKFIPHWPGHNERKEKIMATFHWEHLTADNKDPIQGFSTSTGLCKSTKDAFVRIIQTLIDAEWACNHKNILNTRRSRYLQQIQLSSEQAKATPKRKEIIKDPENDNVGYVEANCTLDRREALKVFHKKNGILKELGFCPLLVTIKRIEPESSAPRSVISGAENACCTCAGSKTTGNTSSVTQNVRNPPAYHSSAPVTVHNGPEKQSIPQEKISSLETVIPNNKSTVWKMIHSHYMRNAEIIQLSDVPVTTTSNPVSQMSQITSQPQQQVAMMMVNSHSDTHQKFTDVPVAQPSQNQSKLEEFQLTVSQKLQQLHTILQHKDAELQNIMKEVTILQREVEILKSSSWEKGDLLEPKKGKSNLEGCS